MIINDNYIIVQYCTVLGLYEKMSGIVAFTGVGLR